MVLPVIKQIILTFLLEILNLEGHLNCFVGLKVTAILLTGWILAIGGVVLGRVCPVACAAGLILIIFRSQTLSCHATFKVLTGTSQPWLAADNRNQQEEVRGRGRH